MHARKKPWGLFLARKFTCGKARERELASVDCVLGYDADMMTVEYYRGLQ